jgi:hypothetical protein
LGKYKSKKSLKTSGQVGEGLKHRNLKLTPTSKKNMWRTAIVLIFWSRGRHAEKYPVLSIMAQDFLAIPLSTVSSKYAFSHGGRILGEARSSLTPEMLEALVYGKDWLFMEKDVGMDNQVQHWSTFFVFICSI